MKQYIVTHQLRSAQPRTETFLGRSFRVVPAVLVRSQVLRNNIGATLLPSDAFTDEWAQLWNNIPVLVGPHPSVRGQPVSGRSPQLINERGAGWIYNARIERESDGTSRLVAEVWIDEARASAVAGLKAVLDSVNAGQPVELSTGFPVDITSMRGVINGENYEAVIHPAGADHLVISTEMTGACSVQHGCGLGVNEQESAMEGDKDKGPFARLMGRVSALLEWKPTKAQTAWEENTAARIVREFEVLNAVSPSDQERSNALRDALQDKFGTQDKTVIICDVYSAEKMVVFWFMTPFGPEPAGVEYFRCSYTDGDGGAFTFDEPVRVRRMTVYEPVAANAANVANAATKKPCGCHQEGTEMDANDRKSIVDEMTSAFNAAVEPIKTQLQEQAGKLEELATNAATKVAGEMKTAFETSLKAVTEQVSGLAAVVNAERDQERQALVQALSTNSRTPFTAAELEAKPLDELRKLAVLAKVEVASYAGRGGPQAQNSADDSDEIVFAEPVPYFAKNTKNGATGAEGK